MRANGKAPPSVGVPWRNRIVGYSDEPTDSLLANPGNWRVHPRNQQDALAGVLRDVGLVQNIICNRTTGHVVDGHLRVTLALRDGQPTVPVTWVELTEAEEAEVLATLDPVAAMASADAEKLDALLREVQSGEAGVQAMLADLAKENGLYQDRGKAEDSGADVDKAGELQAKWSTERGQIWTAGRHRLMCGDSTVQADVDRLMAGRQADLVVTSPPYPGADMWQDEAEAPSERIARLDELNRQLLKTAWRVTADGGVVCWNVADVPWGNHGVVATTTTTTTACREIGFVPRSMIIWDKGTPVLPPPAFMRRPVVCAIAHETILVLYKGDWKPREKESGVASEDKQWLLKSVWPIPTACAKKVGHKAPFPVELARRCIALWSLEGDTVADFCLGSGTVCEAAEVTGRGSVGMELEPQYLALALERLSGLGLSPVLADG